MQVVCQTVAEDEARALLRTNAAAGGAGASSSTGGDGGGEDPNKRPWRERALAELLKKSCSC